MRRGRGDLEPADRMIAIDPAWPAPGRPPEYDAVVLVDVLCDTSTLVTSFAQGRDTFAVANGPMALQLAKTLRDPIIATSERDTWRPGFEMSDSPALLARRADSRPFVLACALGGALASAGPGWPDVYLLCLRNLRATARHLARAHRRVLVVEGACDGDVRCEDQIASARLVGALDEAGFTPWGLATRASLQRWGNADPSLAAWGRSAEDLRRRGRSEDLDFVLSRLDDVDVVCSCAGGRVQAPCGEAAPALSGIA